jgi:RNA polymerase sigma-70 factor (ECF subfamily)
LVKSKVARLWKTVVTTTPQSVVGILKVCLQSGSAADWESFIKSTRTLIARTVASTLRQWIVPSFDVIEDLTQEVYLTLCANDCASLRNFRSEQPEALIKYLKAVSSSVAIDYLRANSAQKRGEGRATESIEAIENSVSREPGPRSSLEHRTLLLDVDRCLRSRKEVPARDRWIFWMYYRHGMTAKAISGIAALELSQKGVESTIQRLTRQVRECMGHAHKTITISGKAEGNGGRNPSKKKQAEVGTS